MQREKGPVCAARAKEITSFIVMDVLERAKELEGRGEEIIHLEIGEPDFDTPEPIREAAQRALAAGDTHYTHSLGKLTLREAITAFYRRKYGVSLAPEQIIVTSGSSPGLLLALSVLMEEGREVILPDPHYACYPNFIRYLGGKPVYLPVRGEEGFKYHPAALKKAIGPATAALLLNSPANPTGAVYNGHELAELADLGCPIVSDEVYGGLVYGEEAHTILEFTENALVIGGFSKVYAMTGWRLGYVIAPPAYVRPLQRLQQNLFICAASFVQEAALAALTRCDSHVAAMVEMYDRRRCYLLERLRGMGIAPPVEPKGAFYVLADTRAYTSDSLSFAFEILEKAKVAVTPGVDFGPHAEGHLRISYANSLEKIAEGLDRLQSFLAQSKAKKG